MSTYVGLGFDARHKKSKMPLAELEGILRRGEARLSLDVATFTMMIRTARTIPLLNDAILCVQEKSSKNYFTGKLGELPHPNIVLPDRLQFGAACRKEAHKILLQCVGGLSHVHVGGSEKFDAFIYQEAVCSKLLAEHGHTVTEKLPGQIAKLAKDAGLSNSNRDFHPAFKSPQHPSSLRMTSLAAKEYLEQDGTAANDENVQQIKGRA
jgi:hypothetical protein